MFRIGEIGFQLMVPILSGCIACAIADRPAWVPGMIGGWIANTGALYDSEAGAGFIGAIVTGFLAGCLVLWTKKVKVPGFARPIMPIIVIPVVATSALGLFYIHVIGKPIAWVLEQLTGWLSGMTGTNAILLGAILGLMIAFDMGGPVNKTAFLFGAGLIASGNQTVMGMCAAAIPVMPLGQGLATLVRRRLYSEQERETGMAALFMGFFGISEGAIPFAAARPAQVIPANMLGGAVAGALAGLAGVKDAVPHGGPIVAVLGAVGGVPMLLLAIVVGTIVTALTTNALIGLKERGEHGAPVVPVPAQAGAPADARVAEPVVAVAGAAGYGASGAPTGGTRTGGAVEDIGTDADGRGAESEAEAEVSAGTGAEAGAGTGAGAEAGAEAAPQAGTGTRVGTGTRAGQGSEVLSGCLTARAVSIRLDATGKEAAIREMAAMLATTGRVRDMDELVRAALAREEQGTTGLGEEIAVPHAKTDAVTAPVVGFARAPEGIEWGSPDGTKARLIFMITVPEAAAGDEHLRILSLLSRRLTNAEFRERLLAAPDEPSVPRVLAEIA